MDMAWLAEVGAPRPSLNVVEDLADLLRYDFMRHAFEAGTVVAVVAGVVGYFVVLRSLAFAGHALAHIGFAGATGAVVVGVTPIGGLLAFTSAAAVAMGALGRRLHGRDVAIGIVLAWALGLGVLFLSLYSGYATEAYALLFGEILGISATDVTTTIGAGAVTLLALAILYRPLLFASLDEEVAEARGVPVRLVGTAFMIVLAIAVSEAVQVVGVLLVFALLVTPAAIAQQLSRRPPVALAISAVLALAFTWAGLVIAYYSPHPVSFFITTIAFASYLICRGAAAVRRSAASRRAP